MLILIILFWGTVFLLSFTYLGYPLLLWLVAKLACKTVKSGTRLPSLTVLISAYNESDVIRKKIENTLQVDYPRGLLQIIVISDASTDETNEIAASFAKQGVELMINEQRKGKTLGLNQAINNANGEILMFTDADAFFDKDTFRIMVQSFTDPTVGLVTGSTRYYSQATDGSLVFSLGLYSRLERWLKIVESKVASCVGADGAVFALRKDLYRSLDAADINDFIIPLNTIRQGFRVICDPNVFCHEEQVTKLSEEFARQVRIANRTARALLKNRDLLNPCQFGHFSWMLLFHKWLRFVFPVLFLVCTATNLLLAILSGNPVYLWSLSLMLLMLLLPFSPRLKTLSLSEILQTFIMSNFAILIGWKRALSNEVTVTWDDHKSSL